MKRNELRWLMLLPDGEKARAVRLRAIVGARALLGGWRFSRGFARSMYIPGVGMQSLLSNCTEFVLRLGCNL